MLLGYIVERTGGKKNKIFSDFQNKTSNHWFHVINANLEEIQIVANLTQTDRLQKTQPLKVIELQMAGNLPRL